MLVVVLVLVAILALAGLRFVMQLSDENRAVYLGGDQVQAEALLASGETAIMAMLKKSPEEREDRRRLARQSKLVSRNRRYRR